MSGNSNFTYSSILKEIDFLIKFEICQLHRIKKKLSDFRRRSSRKYGN